MSCQAISLSLIAVLSFVGCAGSPFDLTRDPISAGSAKLMLKAGTTTQGEVLEVFGGPNIVTGDAARNETWTYARMSYDSSSAAAGGAEPSGAGAVPTASGSAFVDSMTEAGLFSSPLQPPAGPCAVG